MTEEGKHPLTPLTTARLQEILNTLERREAVDPFTIRHVVAELIDMRARLQRIAAACPDKDTAHALIELVGVED